MPDCTSDPERLDAVLQALKPRHIERSRLKVHERPLGRGGFSVVLLADLDSNSSAPVQVAVKQLVIEQNRRQSLVFRLAREMFVWKDMNHPNVIRFWGYYLSPDMTAAWLISPYAPFGSVDKYVRDEQVSPLERLKLVLEAAKGLQYLHTLQPSVCHGDLKAANVLVQADRTAALCDFGLAAAFEDGEQPTGLTTSDGFKGSVRWCSPEVLEGGKRSLQADLWAYGCFVLEVFTERLPYNQAASDPQVILLMGEERSPEPEDTGRLPDLLLILIRCCWDRNPAKRISAQALCASLKTIHTGLTQEAREMPQELGHSHPTSFGSGNPHPGVESVPDASHRGHSHQKSPSQELADSYLSRQDVEEHAPHPSTPQRQESGAGSSVTIRPEGGPPTSPATMLSIVSGNAGHGVAGATPAAPVTPRGILASASPKPVSPALPVGLAHPRSQGPESPLRADSLRKPSTISFQSGRTLANGHSLPHAGRRASSPAPSGYGAPSVTLLF